MEPKFKFPRNCPVIERTADGQWVGRCWHYLDDGKTCPRHGDVSEAVERLKKTDEPLIRKE